MKTPILEMGFFIGLSFVDAILLVLHNDTHMGITHLQHSRANKGFTVAELIVVIVVIILLATVVIAGYSAVRRNAAETAMRSDLRGAASDIDADRSANGNYPATFAEANNGGGLKVSDMNTMQYVTTSGGSGYCISVSSSFEGLPIYRYDSEIGDVEEGYCPGHSGAVASAVAGSIQGMFDTWGDSARFNTPGDLVAGPNGNIYVADTLNNRIRRVTTTPDVQVTTIAGSATGAFLNGTGTGAQFYRPDGIAMDSAGNFYIADRLNNRIRMITPTFVVSTYAGTGVASSSDGPALSATFNAPSGVAVDSAGNVYVSESSGNKIRKIAPGGGTVSTLAGSGSCGSLNSTGLSAQFCTPQGLDVDSAGNVYVADYGNDRVRKITSGGVTTTLAGSTPGYLDATTTAAQFAGVYDVAVDTAGNVYVVEVDNARVRKVTSGGVVTTVVGSGTTGSANGVGSNAEFNGLYGITIDSAGNLYVSEGLGHLIRKITL